MGERDPEVIQLNQKYTQKKVNLTAVRMTFIYLVVATVLVFLSDYFAGLIFRDPETPALVYTFEGWLFVLVAGMLLFFFICRSLADLSRNAEHLERVNRVYRLLNSINRAIFRIHSRNQFLHEACCLAVEYGLCSFAWIGRIDETKGCLVPVTSYGPSDNYLQAIRDNHQTPAFVHNHSPELVALKYSRTVVISDIRSPKNNIFLQKQALKSGFRALAALPIDQKNGSENVMAFYLKIPYVFNQEEIVLLEEFAADIGMGLEHIDKAQQIQQQANYDLLTGLINRQLLLDWTEEIIRRTRYNQRYTGLLVFDIHRLRDINNAFGHYAGDLALRRVARHLKSVVRPGDRIARIESDKFAILLNEVARPSDAEIVAEKLLRSFPLRIEDQDREYFIHLNAGGAVAPLDADKARQLLERAEMALHGSVQNKNNTCTFYGKSIDKAMQHRHTIIHELQGALEREEFYLLYQPIVSLADGGLKSAEALLRWNNRLLGQISPGEFIPIAEDAHLITDLGKWVLKKSCEQHKAWLAETRHDHKINVSINIAAQQLLAGDFINTLRSLLKDYSYQSPELGLSLEITETNLLHEFERGIKVLNEAHDLGFEIHLDDFGTGYSSLVYLNCLPVDKVKIDRSFVSRLPDDQRSCALVNSIISLAHSLNLEVIGEGVETREQLDALSRMNCDAVQGFLLGRPTYAENLPLLLRKNFLHELNELPDRQ
ncbi:MAG: bifunctional diguanylate cyclase/phosphodiesterase [Thermodesulfobacteriota bacterium]